MEAHPTGKQTPDLTDTMAYPPLDTIFESSDSMNEFLDLFRSLGSGKIETPPSSPLSEQKETARSRSSSLESMNGVLDPALEFLACPFAAESLAQAGFALDGGTKLVNETTLEESAPTDQHHEDGEYSDEDEEPTAVAFDTAQTTSTTKPKRRKRKVYEPERRVYFSPSDKDVLCQRGGLSNSHEGNKRFRAAKDELQELYFATPKLERTRVSQKLVDVVHAWGGHFLRKDATGWYEVHNHVARTKAGQALRETYTPEDRAAKRAKYAKKKNAKRKSNQ